MFGGVVGYFHRPVPFAKIPIRSKLIFVGDRDRIQHGTDGNGHAVRCGLFARFIRFNCHGDDRLADTLCNELAVFYLHDLGRA